ncbi:hypothetical protein CF327_g2617 [Tilletia walkeri]|uniref:Trafficking protein particle complex subunit 6B n=2 Tax=Tilletia TaxID=13289 RepID=A0A8X7T6S7_9BASI|nr:hypothetical protein CF327_g2617 [Tilletia walkeri]KAE8260625.1 hypothetical protein A4X13_0g238 [Tilletia indica]KAE8271032.1 hypothetical protein A4X09_0g1343 [Tilletia walkeri]
MLRSTTHHDAHARYSAFPSARDPAPSQLHTSNSLRTAIMTARSPSAAHRLSLGQPNSAPSYALPTLSGNATPSGRGPAPTGSQPVTQHALQLAAPAPKLVDAHALLLLTTETHALLRASATHCVRQTAELTKTLAKTNLRRDDLNATAPDIEFETSVRMEAIGFHVGANIAQRLAGLRPPLTSTLDVLKFICKELWTTVWEKQVDNLRTNHRGVYVLQDNAFKPLLRMSTPSGQAETARQSKSHLAYPIGIVRGALAQMGVPATVVAETNQLPQCVFHIKTTGS